MHGVVAEEIDAAHTARRVADDVGQGFEGESCRQRPPRQPGARRGRGRVDRDDEPAAASTRAGDSGGGAPRSPDQPELVEDGGRRRVDDAPDLVDGASRAVLGSGEHLTVAAASTSRRLAAACISNVMPAECGAESVVPSPAAVAAPFLSSGDEAFTRAGQVLGEADRQRRGETTGTMCRSIGGRRH